jgi:hypothetical protein
MARKETLICSSSRWKNLIEIKNNININKREKFYFFKRELKINKNNTHSILF